MKKFITARPEAGSVRFDSAYEPVLAGVAHGLARLFPPVPTTQPAQGGQGEGGHSSSSRTAEASGNRGRDQG